MLEAANGLNYRDFLTVALVVPEDAGFPDNWIYVHSPEVQLGRVQNFGSWSPYMVKPGFTCLGLEYFVNEGDELWSMADDDLIALRRRRAGPDRPVRPLGRRARLRRPRAEGVSGVRRHVPPSTSTRSAPGWPITPATCSPSAATACTGTTTRTTRCSRRCSPSRTSSIVADHDLWAVNVDDEYHEDGRLGAVGTGRAILGDGLAAPRLRSSAWLTAHCGRHGRATA